MTSFRAFFKKEFLEQLRSGRLPVLGILFVLLGVMNPAVAKLTPWLLEVMADSLAETGITVSAVSISALDSWTQFFKNIPMGLLAFVLLQSQLFTKEYQTGTLVLSLTKGLSRSTVVATKAAMLFGLWSVGYWLCFGITYVYNAYFWDNAVARHLLPAVTEWWLFGIWILSLLVLFSTVASSNTAVLCATGGAFLLSSLLGLLPRWSGCVPTALTDGTSLVYGLAEVDAHAVALWITLASSAVFLGTALRLFNKKSI